MGLRASFMPLSLLFTQSACVQTLYCFGDKVQTAVWQTLVIIHLMNDRLSSDAWKGRPRMAIVQAQEAREAGSDEQERRPNLSTVMFRGQECKQFQRGDFQFRSSFRFVSPASASSTMYPTLRIMAVPKWTLGTMAPSFVLHATFFA